MVPPRRTSEGAREGDAMRNDRRKLAGFSAFLACGAMLATAAAAAITPPTFLLSDAPHARRPQRTSTRATSLEWMADVYQRLRTLEDHAAEAARTPPSSRFTTDPLGRLHPQLPAAGDGARQ